MQSRIAYVIDEDVKSPLVVSQVINLISALRTRGVEIFLLARETSDYSFHRSFSSVWDLVCQFLRRPKCYDIAHFRGYGILMWVGPLLRLVGIKIVWDPRGTLPEEYWYQKRGIRRVLGFIYFKFGEGVCLLCANEVVAVSSRMKRHYASNWLSPSIEQMSIIPTLPSSEVSQEIDVERKDLGFRDEDKIFCFSGSLSKWQMFEETCGVMNALMSRHQDIRLMVLTRDVDRAEEICSSILDRGKFRVLSVHHTSVQAHLKLGDFALLLREDITLNNVSAPVKINDYVYAGLYTFASACIGDVPELFRHYNLGLPLSSLEEASDEICNLLEGDTRLQKIDATRFKTNHTSLGKISKDYEKLYEELQGRCDCRKLSP